MEQLTVEEQKCLYKKNIDIMHSEYYSHRQFEEAAIRIGESRAYETAGYTSFEAFHKAEFPDAHSNAKRKYQILKFAEVVSNVTAYTFRSIRSEPPASEFQARPLAKYEPKDQAALWQIAQEETGKQQPSGREVAAVAHQVQPTPSLEEATHQRIGRLDTDRTAKPPPQEPERTAPRRRVFGYFDAEAVASDSEERKLYLTYIRPSFTLGNGTKVKEMVAKDVPLPFYVLQKLGWTPPGEGIETARDTHSEDDEEEDDLPGPFTAGRDFSALDALTNPPKETPIGMAAEAMNLMFADDYPQ